MYCMCVLNTGMERAVCGDVGVCEIDYVWSLYRAVIGE